MANEDLDDKDLEKDDLEQEEEQDDESIEESSESGEEKTSKEDKKEEQQEGDEPSEEEPKDEEREALRARRRRQKTMKRERQRRERFEHQNQISELSTIVKQQGELINKLQKGSTENEVARIDAEIQDCQRVYQEAQLVMEKAITENNGQNFRKAKEISDKVWARYNTLELTKRQRPGTAKATGDSRGESTRTSSSGEASTVADAENQPKIKLGNDALRYGTEFQRRHSSWYKANPNNGQAMNLDSTIVQLLDRDLYNEGYDPETKDYWDELEDRMKERIPHRFKNQSSQKARPKIITGGGGSDNSGGGTEIEKRLPKEFVEAMKMSGNYEDPKKRKAYIDNYMKNQKVKKG